MLEGQLFKTSGLHFGNWFFGPEKLSGLSRNRPAAVRDLFLESPHRTYAFVSFGTELLTLFGITRLI